MVATDLRHADSAEEATRPWSNLESTVSALGFVGIGLLVALGARALSPPVRLMPARAVFATSVVGAVTAGVTGALVARDWPRHLADISSTGFTLAFVGACTLMLVLDAMSPGRSKQP